MISERQIQIIMIMHDEKNYITFQKISEKLNISLKTVRNDIASIKKYLSENEIGKVTTKPHFGVILSIDEFLWENLQEKLKLDTINFNENANVFFNMIYILIKKKHMCISNIKKEFYVSRLLLDKTLNKVNEWFSNNSIQLEKKKGKGVEIFYTEYSYRKAMWEFFNEFSSFICERNIKRTCKADGISETEFSAITNLLDGFDISYIIETINLVETQYGFRYNYHSNIRAVFFISLSIIRIKKKFVVEMPAVDKCKIHNTFDDLILNDIVYQIKNKYNLKFSIDEIDYLKYVLSTSEIEKFENEESRIYFQNNNIELCKFTLKFINLISEISGGGIY